METRGRLDRAIEFLAVGHVAVDVKGGRRTLGGAAAFACRAAYRLGLAPAMVTAVGEDFDGFEPLEGIEIHYLPSRQSTSFENIYEGDKRRQRLLGRAGSILPEHISAVASRLAEDAVVLFCPIARELTPPFPRLTERGLCAVAPQGFFRRWDADGTIHPMPWESAEEALTGVDFVSVSAADPPVATRFVRGVVARVPIVALTEGPRGARVYVGGRCYRVPAFLRAPVDPTGAGDVFAASFLIALRDGLPPLDAAQFACCAASFAVEAEGVQGMPPDRDAIEERLEVYRRRFRPEEETPW